MSWISSCDSDDGNSNIASLNQLIAEFKSNLVRRKINLQGKLTLTSQDSSEIEILFHPLTSNKKDTTVSSPLARPLDVHLPLHSQEKAQDEHPNLEVNSMQFCVPFTEVERNKTTQSLCIIDEQSGFHSDITNIFSTRTTEVLQHIPFSLKGGLTSRNEAHSAHNLSKSEVYSSYSQDSISLTNTLNIPDPASACKNMLQSSVISNLLPDKINITPNNVPLTSSSVSLPPFENIIHQKCSAVQQTHPSSMKSSINHQMVKCESCQSSAISSYGNKSTTLRHSTQENISDTTHTFQESSHSTNGILLCKSYENVSRHPDRCSMTGDMFSKSEKPFQSEKLEGITAKYTSLRNDFSTKQCFKTETNGNDVYNMTERKCAQNGSIKKTNHRHSGSLCVGELESLSHGQLVAILTQVLQGQNIHDVTISAHSSTILELENTDTSGCSSLSKTLDPYLETRDQSNTCTDSATGSVSGLIMSDRRKLTVPKCNQTYKRRKRKEKFLRKTGRSSMMQNKPSCNAETVSSFSTRSYRMSLRKRQNCENNSDSANFKHPKAKYLQKSNAHSPPLKKRSRLHTSVLEDFNSDNNNCFGEVQTSKQDISTNEVIFSKDATPKVVNLDKLEPSKDDSRREVETHNSGFQCIICCKILKTKDSLYHHQRGLHTKDKPYTCKQCNATFSFHHSYKLHVQKHNGERPYNCNICDKTYLTSNHLKVHVEAVHSVGCIICHICGKTFSYKCSLKQHLYKHTGERPYPCSRCEKNFTTKQSLLAHTVSHSEDRNYSCEMCGKLYKSEYSKNIHMRHHGKQVRQFMCELCGSAFFFKSTLKAHINIHSKARPYVCPQCGKAFKSKASLCTHKYVHRDSQPFICSICGKAFKTKNCCSSHMKRHEKENSYSCSQCGSEFPDKGGLSKHVKTIHVPKKQFTCKICGKKGTRCDNMRTHVKSHRNETISTINLMDFITEENITDNNLADGFIHSRPRMRGPKQKVPSRLCLKVAKEEIGITLNVQYPNDKHTIPERLVTEEPVKSEALQVLSLPSTLKNVPVYSYHQFNSFITTSETNNHQETVSPYIEVLTTEHQHHDQYY